MSINGVNSDHKYAKCGVPHGSILEPLLFLIYINDLPNSSSNFKFILYVHDTTLLFRGSNVDILIQDITNELHKIISWFNTNKFHLNTNKLTVITFYANPKQCTHNKHIVFDDTNVYQSSTTNFLDIITDKSLTWLPNIHFISTKMAKTIGILRHLFKYVSTKILLV